MRQNLLRRLQAFFSPASTRPRPKTSRPRLEALEDRAVPTISAAYQGAVSVIPGLNINSTKADGPQSEIAIAVNPTNPANMIVAPNDLFSIFGFPSRDNVWVTLDAGASWRKVAIPHPAGTSSASGDPTVVFDRFGRAVYAHLIVDNVGDLVLGSAASTDGGLTWTPGKPKTPVNSFGFNFNDKEILAVGPDYIDPTRDRFYLAWHQFNVIYASNSLDGINWSKPTKVSDDTTPFGSGIFSVPAVGANGELYVVWLDFATPGQAEVKFDRSFNGGRTWSKDQVVATINMNPFNDTFGGGGKYYIPAQFFRGITAAPYIDVDRTNGPNRGRVYISFGDAPNGIGNQTDHDNTDIFLVHSDNASNAFGKPTFSPRVRVNDDVGVTSQFMAALAVDQSTGQVGLAWYDARNDSNNVKADFYGAISTDGGNTFLPNIKFSAAPSDIGATGDPNDFGDYAGLAFVGGTLFPAWCDASNSTNNNPDGTFYSDLYTSSSVVTSTGGLLVTATGTNPDPDADPVLTGDDTFSIRLDVSGNFVQFYENNPAMTGAPDLIVSRAALRSISINGLGGNDTVIVDVTNGNPFPTGGLTFNGGDGDDTVTVKTTGSLSLPSGAIIFNGGEGANTLGFDVGATLTLPNGALTFTSGTGDTTLSIKATTLTVPNNSSFTFTGDVGNDTFNLTVETMNLPATGLVFNGGGGNDTFVTSATTFVLPLTATGPAFTVNGGIGNDTVRLTGATINLPSGGFLFNGAEDDDTLSAAFNSAVVADGPMGTMGPIFTFNADNGNDTLALTGTALALPANGFVYVAGIGNDRLELSGPAPFATVPPGLLTPGNLFDGGAGDDVLVLKAEILTLPTAGFTFTGDAGNDALEIWASQINAGAGGAGPTFAFNGGLGNDTLTLTNANKAAGYSLTLNGGGFSFTGGAGGDLLRAEFSSITVAGTGKAFTFDAGADGDVLALTWNGTLTLPAAAFDYFAGEGNDTLDLAFSALQGVAAGTLVFNGEGGDDSMTLKSATLTLPANGFTFNGGTGNDSLQVAFANLAGPANTTGFLFNGGTGNDSIGTTGTASRNWSITGLNNGTMNVRTSFLGVENLTSGAGNDTITFQAAGRITGALDAGAGTDTLNLAAAFPNVTVALTALNTVSGGFNATYAGLPILSVNSVVVGASAQDVLIGANTGGTWTLAGANGSYVGNAGGTLAFSGFNRLLGGNGIDRMNLSLAAGNPIPTTGLTFDGGLGNDSLNIVGSAAADSFTFGPNYVVVNGRALYFLRGEAVSVSGGAGNDVFSANSVSMQFASLVMRGDDGSDLFSVAPSTTTAIQVLGDAPTTLAGGDTLILNRAGVSFVGARPSKRATMGTFAFAGRQALVFSGIENYDAGSSLFLQD